MKIGSPEHKELFCRTFIAGHRVYDPLALPWPHLEGVHLKRLRAIPFWGVARAMERKAGMMVKAYGATESDPLIREAIELQGVEEARHARLISHLIERYGIEADDVAVPQPEPVKDDFVVFGYEECLDAFLGFALYRIAKDIGFFPDAFTDIFKEILNEEARHITFFLNWYRYEEARAGRDKFGSRHILAVKNYLRALRGLVKSFAGDETTGFAAPGATAMIEGVTPKIFLEAALAENAVFMGRLHPRLIKPSLLPVLATIVLTALRALPPLKPSVGASPLRRLEPTLRPRDLTVTSYEDQQRAAS